MSLRPLTPMCCAVIAEQSTEEAKDETAPDTAAPSINTTVSTPSLNRKTQGDGNDEADTSERTRTSSTVGRPRGFPPGTPRGTGPMATAAELMSWQIYKDGSYADETDVFLPSTSKNARIIHRPQYKDIPPATYTFGSELYIIVAQMFHDLRNTQFVLLRRGLQMSTAEPLEVAPADNIIVRLTSDTMYSSLFGKPLIAGAT